MGSDGDDEVLFPDEHWRRVSDDVLLPGDICLDPGYVSAVRHTRPRPSRVSGGRECGRETDNARSSIN